MFVKHFGMANIEIKQIIYNYTEDHTQHIKHTEWQNA